jgi:ubiquinone/menaquinone biosynthesis C-methylase UbiE
MIPQNVDFQKMHFYEKFAADFDSVVNMYDTKKRMSVVFDELLANEKLKGKQLLDAGCGTGWFSAEAVKRGAKVTSMDLGKRLLREVAKKTHSKLVVGSVLAIPFIANTFDYIISSEVIEHVTDSALALEEFYRVLKPGGKLVLTTPNKLWYFSLLFASFFQLRPYQGLENWHYFGQLRRMLKNTGFSIEKMTGIHALPFVFPIFNPVLDFLHQFRVFLAPAMVNIAVKCRK